MYLQRAKALLQHFAQAQLLHIPRELNTTADELAKDEKADDQDILTPAYDKPEVYKVTSVPEGWMDKISRFLREGELPSDRHQARKLWVKAAKYILLQGQLFRHCYSWPLANCVREEDTKTILERIHANECGTHAARRNLALQILRQGYYWPSLHKDAKDFSKRCLQCQIYSNIPRQPVSQLQPLASSWPFSMWGLDFLGPFPKSGRNLRHTLIATDYFSKWVEAKPMAQPTSSGVKSFIWTQLIYRFRVPLSLVCDNGTAFTGRSVRDLCFENGFTLHFASVRHPQSNGQVEATNKNFLKALKRRLEGARSSWADELPAVIWGLNCTPTAATGQTPYSLVFGGEALVPIELEIYSPRVEEASNFELQQLFEWRQQNDNSRRLELDLLEETRELEALRQAEHKRRIMTNYNKHIRRRSLEEGDLVLKLRTTAGKDMPPGKLDSNWEGPFIIRMCLNRTLTSSQDKTGPSFREHGTTMISENFIHERCNSIHTL
ncbi:hypothetical protein AXF42_Ash006701 [Apostasia shenzhenica]|uniref:Integrase catalytic domain-containing protein n=1 Tax=Apostasia shenzhenica TaxID=1088818 RepID=A0A2I0AIX2_9ASPA|nr:hypothetical protein AXF42_Ash006701 [Apostasia shenzhenica]